MDYETYMVTPSAWADHSPRSASSCPTSYPRIAVPDHLQNSVLLEGMLAFSASYGVLELLERQRTPGANSFLIDHNVIVPVAIILRGSRRRSSTLREPSVCPRKRRSVFLWVLRIMDHALEADVCIVLGVAAA